MKHALNNTSGSKLVIKGHCVLLGNISFEITFTSNTYYWHTNSDNFLTSHKVPLTFMFPDFVRRKKLITHEFAVNGI